MAMPPIVGRTWTERARHIALALVLLVGWSSMEPASRAQADSLMVLFTPRAGTFVGTETVALRVQAKADIHYTLDGSPPTVTSPIYRGPVTLDKSTRLRAVAVAAGTEAREASGSDARGGADRGPREGAALVERRKGPVATEIYLRVSQDAQRFTSHLPIILIHTFETGTLDPFATEHVAAALQVMEPTSGRSHLVGRAALDARIGIHVRGATSRNFPKRQYAVELRGDDADTDGARRMLGLPSGSDYVLSDPIVYDRSLIRNATAFALSNRIGRYAPRTRFAEVFLVDDSGDVRAESFLGLFTLIEKIARGPERVDVSRLPEAAGSPPASTGGFILRIDKGAPDFDAGGQWLQFVYPGSDDMRGPSRSAQLDFIRSYIDSFRQAVSAADFTHPSTGQHYSSLIDVDAWIDHHIINTLTKNVDGLRFSAYFHKDRGGRLSAGPVWDFDRSLGTPYDPRAAEPEEWNQPWNATDYFRQGWWRLLFRDPDFRSRYRTRFKALLQGAFSANNLDRVVDGLAAQVGDAAERDFQRWPQFPPRDGSHAAEVEVLKDFLRRRAAWIAAQLDTAF